MVIFQSSQCWCNLILRGISSCNVPRLKSMPIIVDNFTWAQTDDFVIVNVPLRNRRPYEVDVFTSSNYIKVSFPPYLFEAALLHDIDEDRSKCVLRDNVASFELAKSTSTTWTSLTMELTKQELIRLKENAISDVHKREEKLDTERKYQKSERQHACVQQQLALEEKARTEIKSKKDRQKDKAVGEFMEWKKTETDDDKTLLPLWKKLEVGPPGKSKEIEEGPKDEQAIFDDEAGGEAAKERRGNKKCYVGKPGKLLPPAAPIRNYVRIKCDFTYRSFPTPMRESRYTEEEEWLSKQAEARRRTGFVVEDLRPEENNLEWLLEKGKSFHEVGNYLGAVSAFSHAIRTWDKIPELYCARADSQVKLGNWRRAMFDASDCLDLCRPHVAGNADMRFRCHLNRGISLLEIDKPKAALADFVEALELRPGFAQLEHLIDRAESMASEQEVIEQQETMRRLIAPPHMEGKVETQYLTPADLAN